ncbi:MAG: DUF1080 domain-containing protein [Gemmatimonadaceae bacterium]
MTSRMFTRAPRAAGLRPFAIASLALTFTGAGCHSTSSAMQSESLVASAAPNQLTHAERRAGWRLLFDGRSLAGWRGLGYPGVPVGHWTVEDGAIRKIATEKVAAGPDGRRPPGGDLITVATFKDFELEWDWKMSSGGNSGLKYNVSEELSGGQPSNVLRPATGTTGVSHSAIGFEYQMIDDDRHSDGKLPTHRSGALYDLITPDARKQLKPIGEWNHSRIVFNGAHGEHWLNGVKVVEYELGSRALDSALAASKFRSMPWYAQRRTGHIVLQDHGDDVWIRSVKIRELKGR